MSKTAILPCKCKHDFQDKQYGKGMRVHNFTEKSEKWRCTVCKSEK